MKPYNKKELFFVITAATMFVIGCADVDDPDLYAQSNSPDDSSSRTASTTDTDSVSGDDTAVIIDTAIPTMPSEKRIIGDDCMAPDREEYMASFGITMDDDDLSDPNVVAGKRHTILFVFDKSGSMASSWNADGGSKWDIARDAMLASVEPFQEYLSAGTLFFPLTYGADSVALIDSGQQIEYNTGDIFMEVWDQNMGMYAAGGGTPLMDALEAANDAIAHACEIGLLARPFKLILLTDGMPDYWDAQRGLQLIHNWYEIGIPTTVMGMPGSAGAENLLADIADVGSGGEVDLTTGTVTSEGDADEIIYTNESTYDDFEGDLMIAAE